MLQFVIYMICPHCKVSIRETWEKIEIIVHDHVQYLIEYFVCLECHKLSMKFHGEADNYRLIVSIQSNNHLTYFKPFEKMLIPETNGREPIPKNVESEFVRDYNEAVMLLPHSSRSSAAMSRLCLQHYIEQKHNIKKSDLKQEIQELAKLKKYPSDIIKLFDYVRHYGKFGSHAVTNQLVGVIIDVDSDEAEALLSILEEMFDYDYARSKKYEELNKKLQKKLQSSKPVKK